MSTNLRGSHRVNASRSLVAALSHDDLYLVALALDHYSASLDQVDHLMPSPRLRTAAARAHVLAQLAFETNQARVDR